jgi:hypothetical protein
VLVHDLVDKPVESAARHAEAAVEAPPAHPAEPRC